MKSFFLLQLTFAKKFIFLIFTVIFSRCIFAQSGGDSDLEKKLSTDLSPTLRGKNFSTQITNLPNEVLLWMMNYLSPDDILQLSLVCKELYHLSQNDFLWKTKANQLCIPRCTVLNVKADATHLYKVLVSKAKELNLSTEQILKCSTPLELYNLMDQKSIKTSINMTTFNQMMASQSTYKKIALEHWQLSRFGENISQPNLSLEERIICIGKIVQNKKTFLHKIFLKNPEYLNKLETFFHLNLSKKTVYQFLRKFDTSIFELNQHHSESLPYILRFEDEPNEKSIAHLLKAYRFGWHGLPKNSTDGLKTAKKYAEQGSEIAIHYLLSAHHYGWYGLSSNHSDGLNLSNKYANQGSDTGVEHLLNAYFEGQFGIQKNIDQGMKLALEYAEKGSNAAVKSLLDIYRFGLYTSSQQDPEKALALAKDYAKKGNTAAIAYLIKFYILAYMMEQFSLTSVKL